MSFDHLDLGENHLSNLELVCSGFGHPNSGLGSKIGFVAVAVVVVVANKEVDFLDSNFVGLFLFSMVEDFVCLD